MEFFAIGQEGVERPELATTFSTRDRSYRKITDRLRTSNDDLEKENLVHTLSIKRLQPDPRYTVTLDKKALEKLRQQEYARQHPTGPAAKRAARKQAKKGRATARKDGEDYQQGKARYLDEKEAKKDRKDRKTSLDEYNKEEYKAVQKDERERAQRKKAALQAGKPNPRRTTEMALLGAPEVYTSSWSAQKRRTA